MSIKIDPKKEPFIRVGIVLPHSMKMRHRLIRHESPLLLNCKIILLPPWSLFAGRISFALEHQ